MSKWVKEIKYGTITEGTFQGLIALQVEFSGEDPSSSDEILKLAFEITNKKTGIAKNILFSGKYPESSAMLTLTEILKNHGHNMEAIIDGKMFYPWLNNITWIVVELSSPVWPGFRCNELRLRFSKNLIEPKEGVKSQVQRRFLLVDKEDSQEDVFKFLREAKAEWGILLKNKGVFYG